MTEAISAAAEMTGPLAARARLRAQAEAVLARDKPTPCLPRPLRDAYEAANALSRAVELRRVAQIGAAVYVAMVPLLNLLVVPHPNWVDAAIQVTIAPAISLLIASLFFRPDVPSVARETAATVGACCFCVTTVLALGDAPGESRGLSVVLVCLPAFYVLLFVRLRFVGAACFTVFYAASLAVALLARLNLSPAQVGGRVGLMLAAATPILAALYWLKLRTRRHYLETLVHALRAADLAEGADSAHAGPPATAVAATAIAPSKLARSAPDAISGPMSDFGDTPPPGWPANDLAMRPARSAGVGRG